jgi:hypothetical protein
MPAFTDTQNRTWAVEVHVASVKRVRTLLGVDLLQIVEDRCELLARLADDPVLLVDVLYVLCKPEADPRNISDEDFGRAMSGDALEAGFNALLEGLEGFFQDARRRQAVTSVIAKTRRLAEKILDHTQHQIDQIDVDDAFARLTTSGNSSTTTPASSASTPGS